MSLFDKMKNVGSKTVKAYDISSSPMYTDNDIVSTEFPILNIALGGSVNGGLIPGITVLAGPSRHYKTGLGLQLIKAYQDKYDDALVLFYDSES